MDRAERIRRTEILRTLELLYPSRDLDLDDQATRMTAMIEGTAMFNETQLRAACHELGRSSKFMPTLNEIVTEVKRQRGNAGYADDAAFKAEYYSRANDRLAAEGKDIRWVRQHSGQWSLEGYNRRTA